MNNECIQDENNYCIKSIIRRLTKPEKLYTSSEVGSICSAPGIYAWYFNNLPKPIKGYVCRGFNDSYLVYVGISPSNEGNFKQNLRTRIRKHYKGNASGSTFRKTIGCLLAEERKDLQLVDMHKSVDGKKRLTFGTKGEEIISEWMQNHAQVAWMEYNKPWNIEEKVIHHLSPPLNIEHNECNPCSKIISDLRKEMSAKAKSQSNRA